MKLLHKTALAIGFLAVLSQPALAADAPKPAAAVNYTYGVIDMSLVMRESDAAKGIISQLDGKRTEFQKEMQKEEDALRSAEEQIRATREKMSEEEFGKKRKEFEEKLIATQKKAQERKKMLDDAFGKSFEQLRDNAANITAAVAKERGLAAVLTQDAVILAAPHLDLTDEVMKRLNKDVKKIPVNFSAKK